jgi:pyridoxine/pyridoxamine 5'-phosphate oxidase
MVHDGEYFRRRAAEARAAAFQRDQSEDAEVAGQLALAYAALARRHEKPLDETSPALADEVEA